MRPINGTRWTNVAAHLVRGGLVTDLLGAAGPGRGGCVRRDCCHHYAVALAPTLLLVAGISCGAPAPETEHSTTPRFVSLQVEAGPAHAVLTSLRRATGMAIVAPVTKDLVLPAIRLANVTLEEAAATIARHMGLTATIGANEIVFCRHPSSLPRAEQLRLDALLDVWKSLPPMRRRAIENQRMLPLSDLAPQRQEQLFAACSLTHAERTAMQDGGRLVLWGIFFHPGIIVHGPAAAPQSEQQSEILLMTLTEPMARAWRETRKHIPFAVPPSTVRVRQRSWGREFVPTPAVRGEPEADE